MGLGDYLAMRSENSGSDQRSLVWQLSPGGFAWLPACARLHRFDETPAITPMILELPLQTDSGSQSQFQWDPSTNTKIDFKERCKMMLSEMANALG
jgi:hypothetical protein